MVAPRPGIERRLVFFDLQVNGYAGVDFNGDAVSDEDFHRACERLEEDGVEGCLIAIITDVIALLLLWYLFRPNVRAAFPKAA